MQCDYDNHADVYDDYLLNARKDHKCCECHKKINKGDVYQYISMLYEGQWSNYKQCIKCAEIFDMATQAGACPLVEGLYEMIAEYFNDIDEKFQNYFRKVAKEFLPDYLFEE